MYRIDRADNSIKKLDEKSFSELNFKERDNLQEWIAKTPDVFDREELLIIQKEFDGFNETHERLDLLALDKYGNLVVIENKLDDSGRDVTWQAIKYASYCSTLTKDAVINIYQEYLKKENRIDENAENNISEFLNGQDIAEIEINTPDSLRIILVAASFRREVTSTVQWLLNYKLKIQCFRAKPYQIGEHLFIEFEQILPVKEAQDFSICVSEASEKVEYAKRHKKRLQFWEEFIAICRKRENFFANSKPTKINWINKSLGKGVDLSCSITNTSVQVQINFASKDKEKNKEVFDLWYSRRDSIASEPEGELMWDRMDDRKSSKIRIKLMEIDTYSNDKQKAMEFLLDKTEKLERVYDDLLVQLTTEL